jgi:hypothetical protein
MKTVNIYEVGETVLIKAKVTAIIPDKDRFVYELTADGETDKLKHRFQDKDINPIVEFEEIEEDDD